MEPSAAGEETIRSFVAVAVETPDVVERLRAVARDFGPLRGIRWVGERELHFTLKFLGEIPEERAPSAREALARATADFPPFSLTLAGLGAFPRPVFARILWAGCDAGSSELVRLAGSVEAALALAGFPPETRPFSPHLTIGRVREGGGGRDLPDLLAQHARREFGTVPVEEVRLVKSDLTPRGPIHTALARFPLTA